MDSGANKAYLKARKDIQLPGFRKGKAPRKLIESIYGAHVFYEDGLRRFSLRSTRQLLWSRS